MPKSSNPRGAGAVEDSYLRQIPATLLSAFNTNNRINHYLIDGLSPAAWRLKPPDGKGRTIAAIVAHMHNVRVMWMKAAKATEIPEQLNRSTATPAGALRALERSRHSLSVVMN